MLRPIDEVVASQRAMTTRLASKEANLDLRQLERGMRVQAGNIANEVRTSATLSGWKSIIRLARATRCLTNRPWPR